MRTTRRRWLVLLLSGLAVGCGASPAPIAPTATELPATAVPSAAAAVAPSDVPAPSSSPAPAAPTAAPTATREGPRPSPSPSPEPPGPARTGVEVLLRERPDLLKARRLGLVTNRTGRDRQGRSTIDLLRADPEWQLVALFSPEHGIRGDLEAGEQVDSAVDAQSGLPIHSLYGETTAPTAEMLRGLDALVYDIQDVGARVYTYPATLVGILRAAAQHGRRVVILDRPNPINGVAVEGNVLDPRFASMVGAGPIAMRYGMTIGELGRYFNAELGIGADLGVVPLRGWTRASWYDQAGLAWVNPSPNMRSLAAATLYPGTVLFEGTNLSEGRGTDRPFEWIGAPWVDGAVWAQRLDQLRPPGVRFRAATRTPESSKHAGRPCQGVLAEITDRDALRPMELGLAMLAAVRALHPGDFRFEPSLFDRLAGTDRVRQALTAGSSAGEIASTWRPDLQRFLATRAKYLLY